MSHESQNANRDKEDRDCSLFLYQIIDFVSAYFASTHFALTHFALKRASAQLIF